MNYRNLGWVMALFATFAFSFAPPLARFAILSGMNSTTVLMLRAVIASVLFGAALAFTDGPRLRISRRGLGSAFVIGALNAVGMVLFFLSLSYLEASLAAMILALSPPMVLSLLALRGERLTQRHLVRLGLAMIGVYLLIGPSGDVNWTGALLALLATILFSVQLAATQWLLVGYPVRSIVFYVTIIMAAFVVGWWVILGAPWTDLGPGQWAIVLVLAILSTVVARLAYYGAVGRIGSGQLALFGPLETLLSVIWSILFLNEQLSPVQFLGGALILFSAMLAVERFGRVNLRIPRR